MQTPTARWVFHYFVGIHVLLMPGQWPLVLNLTEEHQQLLKLLGKPYERLAHVRLACSICDHRPMIDFPIGELLDDSMCTIGLEHHLHPRGLVCPHWGSSERRVFRAQGHFPAYRCRVCDGYSTLLTGTVFAKTRQRPATLVLL